MASVGGVCISYCSSGGALRALLGGLGWAGQQLHGHCVSTPTLQRTEAAALWLQRTSTSDRGSRGGVKVVPAPGHQ